MHRRTNSFHFTFELVELMEVEVNASGHIISSKGSIPEITDWLSFRFDFRCYLTIQKR